MIPDLIYDVGMNNGDDTAYYLHKGYRVVAVEVDPALVAQAHDRFASEIRQGRLEIVNKAIGPERRVAQFWICEERSEWNSFDRAIASRQGLPCHALDVQCLPFRDLLRQYGVPLYLKIDIEGHDHYCVADLDPGDLPKYVSVEMGQIDQVFKLHDLGYSGFKLITQNNHSQLAIDLFSTRAWLKRQLRPHPSLFHFGVRLAKARAQLASTWSKRRPPVPANGNGWKFAMGSSGPFGEDTDGTWQTFDDVAYTWLTYQLGRSDFGPPSLWVWHDLHATRAEPG